MMRTRPPRAMPAITPFDILESLEVAEGGEVVGDVVEVD